jgi:hypothetical protein
MAGRKNISGSVEEESDAMTTDHNNNIINHNRNTEIWRRCLLLELK